MSDVRLAVRLAGVVGVHGTSSEIAARVREAISSRCDCGSECAVCRDQCARVLAALGITTEATSDGHAPDTPPPSLDEWIDTLTAAADALTAHAPNDDSVPSDDDVAYLRGVVAERAEWTKATGFAHYRDVPDAPSVQEARRAVLETMRIGNGPDEYGRWADMAERDNAAEVDALIAAVRAERAPEDVREAARRVMVDGVYQENPEWDDLRTLARNVLGGHPPA